ncbi:hypothetical protein COMA1_40359 [Candidatus Nitrospira nitrosa]|uniref:Uncharacterized protein n=1 Tax=Candidatus Nitrospira nitrosa TaxID=1742972 RepID=A0A0S4LKD3_9BACT|nr:hypothetical protein COMA1_40359 [Candidatus Nitrospira nitrosa]
MRGSSFLHTDSAYDGIGSTLALTNLSGTPAIQYSYGPFGKTQTTTPSFAHCPVRVSGGGFCEIREWIVLQISSHPCFAI